MALIGSFVLALLKLHDSQEEKKGIFPLSVCFPLNLERSMALVVLMKVRKKVEIEG